MLVPLDDCSKLEDWRKDVVKNFLTVVMMGHGVKPGKDYRPGHYPTPRRRRVVPTEVLGGK